MKLALLLPGYLDSPDYLDMVTFGKGLTELGYTTERLDACDLWRTGDVANYSITNHLKQIKERISFYKSQNPEEVVLVGHSRGGLAAIIAGNRMREVTKIVALCAPPDIKSSAHKWEDGKARVSTRDLPDDPSVLRTFSIPYSYLVDAMQYSAEEEAKTIHVPLMIFIALDDTTVPPEQTERIVKNAISPYVVRQSSMKHNYRRSQKDCDIVMKEIEKFLIR